jgi:hypothetical protein
VAGGLCLCRKPLPSAFDAPSVQNASLRTAFCFGRGAAAKGWAPQRRASETSAEKSAPVHSVHGLTWPCRISLPDPAGSGYQGYRLPARPGAMAMPCRPLPAVCRTSRRCK